jgi:hypothetical protein
MFLVLFAYNVVISFSFVFLLASECDVRDSIFFSE